MPPKDSSSRSKYSRSRRPDRPTASTTSRRTAVSPGANNSPYQSSLRAAESRFSLNDQFATTRREFEFGFDDASSIFTKVTDIDLVNDDEVPKEELAAVDEKVEAEEVEPDYAVSDYYDLLCLPRSETLTQDQIRAAFYRNFLALYPESHSSKYRAMATIHFIKLQTAYETLMDPARRAEYDLFGDDGDSPATNIHGNYEAAVEGKLRAKMQQVVYGGSEVGIRVDASKLYRKLASGRVINKKGVNIKEFKKEIGVHPLDYALSQSMTVPVPIRKILPIAQLRAVRHRLATMAAPFLPFRKPADQKEKEHENYVSKPKANNPNYFFAVPTVTVAGSVYGLVEGLTQANVSSSLLNDRFQPLLPLTIPRHRIIQLGELRCTPLVAVRVRQEIIHKARASAAAPGEDRWTKSAIEVESDVLPERALTARVSHTFLPPYSAQPWNVEVSATNGRYVTGGIPRLGMGVYRRAGPGTAFFRADSGDWRFGNGQVCNFFGQFAKESRKWFFADFQFPLKMTPSVEVGYKTTPCERWTTTNYADIPRGESGIRGMDREASFAGGGSWAVSASAMPGDQYAGYLRYSLDIPFLAPAQTPSRVEVELCGNSIADHYMALRNLWQVGRFSRLGLEVGVSPYHFHVSLYWSRLSQAVSLPLLLSPRASMNEKVVFWSAVAPFVAVAGVQMVMRWLLFGKSKKKLERNEAKVVQWVTEKRNEAEDFEFLVESHVEARQKREAKKGGLVIVSAKYGVKEGEGREAVWAGSEVADVKIAVASLVDGDGRLEIPRGVRKSHIPGFWDPMPLKEKVLHVRYQYRGKEAVVEVYGREGLTLPPPSL